jgi:hypothetical protein
MVFGFKENRYEMAKHSKQQGLWIPNSILNLPELNWGEKVLLAHFYSFGVKGCWKSNKTLAEELMTSKQTISRMISRLKKYIWIKNPKGYYRTIWVKSHPKVKDFIPGKEFEVNQKCAIGFVKNDNSTSSKQAIGPNQKCATTYTYTNKENYKKEAVDLPMPAGGQASQLLIERKAKMTADFEAFRRRFGNGPRGGDNRPAMTPEECEKRKQELIRGLEAAEKLDRLL